MTFARIIQNTILAVAAAATGLGLGSLAGLWLLFLFT